MKRALAAVAFDSGCRDCGIHALLETVIDALDEGGYALPALRAQLALDSYMLERQHANDQGCSGAMGAIR